MVLVQILRPYLGCRPSVVITMYSCKGDHWIHSGSLGSTAVLTGSTCTTLRPFTTTTFAQVEPLKPSGALQNQPRPTTALTIPHSLNTAPPDSYCRAFITQMDPEDLGLSEGCFTDDLLIPLPMSSPLLPWPQDIDALNGHSLSPWERMYIKQIDAQMGMT